MAQFNNNPQMEDGRVRRFVHQPLTIEHNGINATIKSNGKVELSKVGGKDTDGTLLMDEIEIPASLVFKLASLLKATRKVEFVSMQDDNTNSDKMNVNKE